MKTSYEHNRVEGRSPLPLYQLGYFGDSVSLTVTVSILSSCIMDGCILRDDIALLRLRLNVMLFVNETGDTLGNDSRSAESTVARQLANGTCAIRIRDMFNVLPPYMDYWVSRAA